MRGMASLPPAKKRKLASSGEATPGFLTSDILLDEERRLCGCLMQLSYPDTVSHIYDPVNYAVQTHTNFLSRFARGQKKVLFLGMNPGPFGMAQNGVPFGDATMVREFLGVVGEVKKPDNEHPKRPIHGLECTKNEVSGTRFWSLVKDLCGSPDKFFEKCFVHNYCPLCYMAKTGKNITPPMFKGDLRKHLQDVCDQSLLKVIQLLGVEWVVGVGKYAADRAKAILKQNCEGHKPVKKGNDVETFRLSVLPSGSGKGRDVHVCSIMHPSPINPAANSDWAGHVTTQLEAIGLLHIITS